MIAHVDIGRHFSKDMELDATQVGELMEFLDGFEYEEEEPRPSLRPVRIGEGDGGFQPKIEKQ